MEKIKIGYEIEVTLHMIGGKWKGLILYHLIENGSERFNALHRFIGKTSPRTLTNQLRELEKDGLINRQVFAEVPPRVEYSATEKGKSLYKILELMCEWGYENKDERFEILNPQCKD
ncbi:MAG: helix-turn-helix domain-containing protein [Fusobacterium sp. JB021]|nr:helix-turn-helix domain-containing protein [Fusobacterium sp. JB021]MDP0505886.1 helix-turn-helix domain-containing protein [Fusobacterium sp. JB019]